MTHLRIERARTAMALRQYEAAKREAMAVLENEPNDWLAHLILGEAYLRTDDFAKGREEAAKLISIAPDWGWGYWLMGWCWIMDDKGYPGVTGRARRMPRARTAAERALACDPNQPVFFALAAAAAIESGYADAALLYADRGLAVAPGFHHLYRLRGQALRLLKQPDNALKCLEASLRIAPDDAISHREVAEILFSKGQYRLARERIREAMRLEPQDRYARDLMFRIVQTQHWLLRSAIWFHEITRPLRGYMLIAWMGAVLLAGIPLNYWVELKLRDRPPANAILFAWFLSIFAPLATFVIPWLTNTLWITLGRDASIVSLSRQERWNRTYPGLMIVLAGPAIGLSLWLQSLTPLECLATAFAASLIQSSGAAIGSPSIRLAFLAACVVYLILVAPYLIRGLIGSGDAQGPALILAATSIWICLVVRRQCVTH
jgi:tetratricopeptide (TPR) repeat protein